MTDEFDWFGAVAEHMRLLRDTPVTGYAPLIDVHVGDDRNGIAYRMDRELFDRLQLMREINQRMTEAFLEASAVATNELLGDLDNWRPTGFEMAQGDRNARAREWWRSQRRQPMTLEQAMVKVRTEYGAALDFLGRL